MVEMGNTKEITNETIKILLFLPENNYGVCSIKYDFHHWYQYYFIRLFTQQPQEQRETLKAAVSGVDTVMDSLYDNILPTVNYVLTFKNAGNFMNTDHIDRVLEAKLLNNLNRLEIADSRVNYIGLVNLSAGRYIGTRAYIGIEPEILNWGNRADTGMFQERFLNANIDSSPGLMSLHLFIDQGRYISRD